MSTTLRDRIVVITGASSGIGAAAAREVAARGASVVLVARREAALRDVARAIERAVTGASLHVIVADMTVRADAERVAGEAVARLGRIDAWVNNAGRGITRMPSALTDADIDEMMRVNVKTALHGMQAVLPHFQSRGVGHIVNVSSVLGRVPAAVPRSAYNGAKHFLNALTANLRDEIRETYPGIQISLVSPGIVATAFGANALHGGPDSRQLPNPQPAEEVGAVIADLIESRRPDVYTRAGAKAYVDAYLTGLGEDP